MADEGGQAARDAAQELYGCAASGPRCHRPTVKAVSVVPSSLELEPPGLSAGHRTTAQGPGHGGGAEGGGEGKSGLLNLCSKNLGSASFKPYSLGKFFKKKAMSLIQTGCF